MTNATFLCALAQEAPAKQGLTFEPGFMNLIILLVVTIGFISILVAYIRSGRDPNSSLSLPSPSAAPAPASPAASAANVDDPVLIAVLAAAAYSVLGTSVRVVSVQPVSSEWGMEGRREIFLSHKLR